MVANYARYFGKFVEPTALKCFIYKAAVVFFRKTVAVL